ncbi:MAG: co-chaperone DjlA [Gammaproteobacteria bacterium]|nr:co-chaperone DjlA [Gammaproteobacteria bacterium]
MKTKYIGKIIGGFCGLLLTAGNPVGLLLGVLVGHWFDKSLHFNHAFGARGSATQKVFFDTAFLVMGHIAKADGRVSENEIQVARQIMSRFGLTGAKKQEAIRLFNQGKSSDFNLEATLTKFKQTCPFDRGLMYSFVEIQIQAAYADGGINPHTKQILQYIARFLGIGGLNFALYDMLFGLRNGYTFYQRQGYHYQRQSGYSSRQSSYTSVDESYAILGISRTASDGEIKKAYRKMMSQNHPDKLMAKGLPEEMIKVATEKTQKIQKAYEVVCRARGIK